jgi:hypothetical protein
VDITQSFCIACSKINHRVGTIIEDDVYRELLSSNLTSGIQLTGANLRQFEPVARMRAVVAKWDGMQDEVKSGASVASMVAWPAQKLIRPFLPTSTAGFLLDCQARATFGGAKEPTCFSTTSRIVCVVTKAI